MEVPRDIEAGKRNPQITILCENLCLAIFDKDVTGETHHIYDINAQIFPQLSRAYPEIESRKQALVYTIWAMKAICWNNRAKLVDPSYHGFFESPNTPSEPLNESLPDGSPWQARVPAKFAKPQTDTERAEQRHQLAKAEWSVDYFTKYGTNGRRMEDQEIYDTLTLGGFNAGAVKIALETRNDAGRYSPRLTQ